MLPQDKSSILQKRNKKYEGEVQIIHQDEVKVKIWDIQEAILYGGNIKVKNIKADTVKIAFEENRGELEIQFEEKKDIEMLDLRIIVHPPFLKSFEEVLSLPLIERLNPLAMLTHQTEKLSSRIATFRPPAPRLYTHMEYKKFENQNAMYNEGAEEYYEGEQGYQFTNLISLTLKEAGNYLIEVSMAVKARNQYIYLYKNRDYNMFIFPNSMMMVPNAGYFHQVSVSFKHEAATENSELSLQLYDIIEYPCQIANLVVTAQKLS